MSFSEVGRRSKSLSLTHLATVPLQSSRVSAEGTTWPLHTGSSPPTVGDGQRQEEEQMIYGNEAGRWRASQELLSRSKRPPGWHLCCDQKDKRSQPCRGVGTVCWGKLPDAETQGYRSIWPEMLRRSQCGRRELGRAEGEREEGRPELALEGYAGG